MAGRRSRPSRSRRDGDPTVRHQPGRSYARRRAGPRGIRAPRPLRRSRLDVQHPDRPRVVCGWSLGAAVAFYLASKHESVDGLIAISAWTSLRDVAAIHFPNWLVGLALRESYDSVAIAGQIQQPTLLIHGTRDPIIPVEQGRRLAAAVPDADWLEQESAGHNDLLSYPDVWQAIRLFVDRIEKSRTV